MLVLVFALLLQSGHSEAYVGSYSNNNIRLTINRVTRFDNDQKMKIDYTVMVNGPQSAQMTSAGAPVKHPHIWYGHAEVRGQSVAYKKVNDHTYRGTIIAPIHQYRPQGAWVTMVTHSLLNQQGNWKVSFFLE
ncbi:hypothetical protein [Fictibacillus gelatini]|uniref:hypothetical protein n=1 Tax=Fictibacillus gelatini TaxID=225985 RepID=UPI0012B60CB9|nr:hypothetical protein [Fictibacillus gelatini]